MRPLVQPPSVIREFNQNWINWLYQFFETVKDWGISGGSDTSITVTISGVASIQVDDDATAGNTRFLIYDVDNGTLERVSVGAVDSGGSGFKTLRIPN